MSLDNRNPGALAGATGAECKADELRSQDSTTLSVCQRCGDWGRWIDGPGGATELGIRQSRFKSACRSFGFALAGSNFDNWHGFRCVISARLTVRERAALAYMALTSLTPEEGGDVMATYADCLPECKQAVAAAVSGAGWPYILPREELASARFWAAEATPAELEAFCLATFQALPSDRQTSFLDFAAGRSCRQSRHDASPSVEFSAETGDADQILIGED